MIATTQGVGLSGSGDPVIAPRLLTGLLDHAVACYPDRPAIDFLGRKWSYRELAVLVQRAARGLQDIGVAKGDRVGLCLPNTPYFIIFYFAALRIGAIVVNFNPLYVERELQHQIADSGTTVMVVPDLKLIHDKVNAIAAHSGLRKIIVCPMSGVLPWTQSLGFRLLRSADRAHVPDDALHAVFDDLIGNDGEPDPVLIDPDDVALLQYTGGTTGVPKGAMLTHANLAANSRQMVLHIGGPPAEQQRMIGVLPLFHVFALTNVLNFSVDTAAEMILLPKFDLTQLLRVIRRTKPTYLPAVPTIFGAIVQAADKDEIDFSALKFCISGGAPLPLDIRLHFENLTGCRIVEGYGLSEASPIVTCNPSDGLIKDNSCGIAMAGTSIEIRDLADPHHLLPPGERGEVCVRGPQVMRGYWGRSAETGAVFVDGALRTGDVGYLDEDGYLFLVDRIKDVILCSGYKVYPRLIEDALYEHPDVTEAVVIGVADPYRGQAPKAFVVLRAGGSLAEEDLKAFLALRLSKIEMPRDIEFRASLPRTLIGKLSKKELIAEEAGRQG